MTILVSLVPFPEPASSGAIVSAVQWLESTLLGTVAVIVAVTAVAAFGLLVMSGRIEWRRGATILVGCFILFGAPVIAAGIMGSTNSGAADESAEVVQPPPSRSICWTCGVAPVNPGEK